MQSLNPHSCLGRAWSWRTSTTNRGEVSLFSTNFAILRLPAARRSRSLLISSRQGRRPKRRNPLRQKLLTTSDQVSKILDISTPELRYEKDESMLDRPDDERIGEERSGESELWNKLENWVDQNRRDSETWGIGSGPIFTIYKDGDGNVIRVSLDENEIIRRNQCTVMSLKPKEVKDDIDTKISRAKLIAKEIENGEYKFPENSTIAKIVIEDVPYSSTSSSSSVGRFHLLRPGVKALTAVNPRTFLPIFFSFLLIWSLKKILFTNGREITPQEKEMMRRKLKARKERAMSEQGNVEVISKVPELTAGSEKRPSLDKLELMKNIRSKKASESHVSESVKMIDQVDQLEHGEFQQLETNPLFIASSATDQWRELESDKTSDDEKEVQVDATLSDHESSVEKQSAVSKPRIIVSLNEARNYLSTKSLSMDSTLPDLSSRKEHDSVQTREGPGFVNGSSMDDRKPGVENHNSINGSHVSSVSESPNKNDDHHQELVTSGDPDSSSSDSSQVENDDSQTGTKQNRDEKSWVEENFEQFDPIIKKIGTGFQENYLLAREKAKDQKVPVAELSKAALDEIELEWMNDEDLREIVFKVRDNEMAGKDPFHLMDSDEKIAFFNGLERKAEKINAKMSALHEYCHSRIENIDYGIDGISVHDPPEKIFPRWKGPPPSEDPEFLNYRSSDSTKGQLSPLKSSSDVHNLRKKSSDGASVIPRTVIQSSDGSSRPGKKMGKEHWGHTKKWSREFLQLYNEETDPEIKSIMKDMGKDLDRWITEREIQDVADLMSKIPKRKRKYIEKKMNKLKAEIESYGHQAVFTKYKEYVDEKEEDYLWWLDLSFILCIEMYRVEDEIPKIGFYSLEMASDLDLDPKQYHVIAFEDAGDSKNFCHIMQSHLEMLGNGSAFVVARPPKDAFREAKANGFSVTVIKKGAIKLNVDQTLEEVEEEIVEIGSKVYHDKIMKERGIDMNTLMKGVINADKSLKS